MNFKRHFHNRAETEYEPFLYKLFDLKWVLSSRVSRWRCRIISCYENHVIYFALFQCEIVVLSILRPFRPKKYFFWVTWLRDGILNYSPDTLVILYKLFFVVNDEIMDRRRKFYTLNLGFVFFWVASPIFGTASTIEWTCLNVCHQLRFWKPS